MTDKAACEAIKPREGGSVPANTTGTDAIKPRAGGAPSVFVSLPLAGLESEVFSGAPPYSRGEGGGFISQEQLSQQLANFGQALMGQVTTAILQLQTGHQAPTREHASACGAANDGPAAPRSVIPESVDSVYPQEDSFSFISGENPSDVARDSLASEQDLEAVFPDLAALAEPPPVTDPFSAIEGLAGFALPGLAAALSTPQPTVTTEPPQVALWQAARGGTVIRRIAVDKAERLYRATEGPFAAPVLPTALSLDRRVVDTDTILLQQQQQWGTLALALSKGLVKLEAVAKELSVLGSAKRPVLPSDTQRLALDLGKEAVTPLAHALRMTAARFNDLAVRRKEKVVGATRDHVMQKQLREAPLALSSFFQVDVSPIAAAADHRRNQSLLVAAVRGKSSHRPAPYPPRSHASGRQGYSYKATDQQGGSRGGHRPQPAQYRNQGQARRPFQQQRHGAGRGRGRGFAPPFSAPQGGFKQQEAGRDQ